MRDRRQQTVFLAATARSGTAMKGTVKWLDGAMFVAESGSGHTVVMDGPEDLGGAKSVPQAAGNAAFGHRRLCYL